MTQQWTVLHKLYLGGQWKIKYAEYVTQNIQIKNRALC